MKHLRKRSHPVPTRNFTIRVKAQKPSDEEEEEDEELTNVWDCGSPLYDSYELVSLSHVIDRHMMVFPSPIGSRSASQLSVASNVIPSRSSSSVDQATSKKLRGSVVLAFLNKLMERNVWKRRTISGTRPGRERSPGRI